MRLTLLVGVAMGLSMAALTQVPFGGFVVIVLLLCCSALFSGSETALFSLQPLDRKSLTEAGHTRVEPLLARPRRTLASILIGNEFVNVLLSTISAGLVLTVAPDHPWINIVLLTPVLLVLGEVLPKVTALRFNRRIATLVAPPLTLFSAAVAPLRWMLTEVADLALRLTGGGNAPRDHQLRESHLRELVDQGRRDGAIGQMEQEIIYKVFEFGDHAVVKLMTPRPDVFSLNLATPWHDLLAATRKHGFSRVPIWQGSPDNVVGILLVKKLLPLLLASRAADQGPPSPRQLRKLLLPPRFVPTLKRADALIDEFRADRSHMAIVVDEHGSLAGVVTLDDLLAELVGELLDETDEAADEITALGHGIYTVQASMDVDDFEAHFEVTLPEGDYHTIGGFVLAQAGEVPEKGTEVTWGGLRFIVSAREGVRLTELSVTRDQGAV